MDDWLSEAANQLDSYLGHTQATPVYNQPPPVYTQPVNARTECASTEEQNINQVSTSKEVSTSVLERLEAQLISVIEGQKLILDFIKKNGNTHMETHMETRNTPMCYIINCKDTPTHAVNCYNCKNFLCCSAHIALKIASRTCPGCNKAGMLKRSAALLLPPPP